MADEKQTILQPVKLRRRIELREFALATLYPQTRSRAAAPHKRTEGFIPAPQRRNRDDPSPPENVAKPWKKPWDK
jgi:hypothetical protein